MNRPPHRPPKKLVAAACLSIVLAACDTAPAPEPAPEPAAETAAWPPAGREIPTDFESGRFLVVVPAGGGELRLLTDTGGGMAVRQGAVERVGGGAEDGVYMPPFGDQLPPLPRALHVSPDDRMPAFLPDGIVGAPWFDGRVWTFDYAGERLLLHEGEATAFEVPEQLAPHTVPLGFQLDDAGAHSTGFPRIVAEVAGEPLDLLLDTGATEPVPAAGGGAPGDVYPVSFIVRSLADGWRRQHPEWTVVPAGDGSGYDSADDGADGGEDGYWLRVPEVRVGGHDVGPVWFSTRPDANFGEHMSRWTDRPIVGALGGGALRGLVVTVDYPRARAVLHHPPPAEGHADLRARDVARTLDSLAAAAYGQQHWAEAARLSERAGELAGTAAGFAFFNAACAHALGGRPDAAFAALDRAVGADYASPAGLESDADLDSLRDDPRWPPIVAAARANAERRQQELGSPDDARLLAEDVDRFWRAYDAAMALDDEDDRARVFRQRYLEPGSAGLLDFYSARIHSAGALAEEVTRSRAYYDAIRDNTLRAHEATDRVRRAMQRMEEIYPPAIFPDVYFLVGRMSSGGTTGKAGLLIGTELYAVDDSVPAAAIPAGAARMVKPVDQLPHVVAHELVHYQQQDLGYDGTLLSAVLREGGADFVSDLILPGAESHYRSWGAAHERAVWERFLADMDGTDTSAWLGNYGTASEDWPADLGYFVGERISAAYYERAADKAQAVRDLLELADPQAIWRASGYAERFE